MLRRLSIRNLVLIRDADLELGPGLTVVTGETGAGKTILTQAVGLLLGAKGDAAYLGPAADEAYVEAELDLPEGVLEDDALVELADLRPHDDPGLVVARRLFADGRSRAYAWGRAAPRDPVAALVERLVAMSGQFEQRRLARASHQLELLDAFAGEGQLARRRDCALAWRELQGALRRRNELAEAADEVTARRAELEALAAAAAGLEAGTEDVLRLERDRRRHAAEIAEAATVAAEALAPELGDGDGAADLASRAGRALDGVSSLAPELAAGAAEITGATERLRETASALRAFLASLDAAPGRLEQIESELGRIADARRRFGAGATAELVEAATAAAGELRDLDAGGDPLAASEAQLVEADTRYRGVALGLREARLAAAEPFAEAARVELASLGLGDGQLRVDLAAREPGATGTDEVVFLIRANSGLPLAPVATTASGGELSRIALALRAVAHARAGEPTIVFDEIDAGIGGATAHAVADALRRLAASCQVVTITHLPQIARVADRHLRVEKLPGDPTYTRIECLSDEERRDELERMLGGAEFLQEVVS